MYNGGSCLGCRVSINKYDTYILCHDCEATICLKCFSVGMEKFDHFSHHDYVVIVSKLYS